MPGSRLTDEDRRQIEAWLAEGLGYAEIGRRLGRPTSTITREVIRNGEPGAYSAERAQRAATDRARRSRPRRTDEPADDEHSSAAVHDFVDEFANLLTATGMPRMTSRVFACLLTADVDGLTAAELVHRLKVSPASVSKAIGFLETMELTTRRSEPGSRRERYIVDDDIWIRAWRADTNAHERLAAAATRGAGVFGDNPAASTRLAAMGRFFAGLSEQMSGPTLADTAVHDALTILAALVHAGRPLTTKALATALDWTPERTAGALESIRRRPDLTAPLTVQPIGPQTFTVAARHEHLSRAQREALEQ